jgi:hypothetical protein
VGLTEPNKEGTRRPTEEGCDVQKTSNLETLQALSISKLLFVLLHKRIENRSSRFDLCGILTQ